MLDPKYKEQSNQELSSQIFELLKNVDDKSFDCLYSLTRMTHEGLRRLGITRFPWNENKEFQGSDWIESLQKLAHSTSHLLSLKI